MSELESYAEGPNGPPVCEACGQEILPGDEGHVAFGMARIAKAELHEATVELRRIKEQLRSGGAPADTATELKGIIEGIGKMVRETVVSEGRLNDFIRRNAGGAEGQQPPMDLTAARGAVLGRLARLAERMDEDRVP